MAAPAADRGDRCTDGRAGSRIARLISNDRSGHGSRGRADSGAAFRFLIRIVGIAAGASDSEECCKKND